MSLEELSSALEAMMNNKGPGLDGGPSGLALEFFKACWYFIKDNYLTTRKFSKGVTKWLIILLHKGDSKHKLTN